MIRATVDGVMLGRIGNLADYVRDNAKDDEIREDAEAVWEWFMGVLKAEADKAEAEAKGGPA